LQAPFLSDEMIIFGLVCYRFCAICYDLWVNLRGIVNNLEDRLSDLDEKEISSMLKSDEGVNVKGIIKTIVKEFKNLR